MSIGFYESDTRHLPKEDAELTLLENDRVNLEAEPRDRARGVLCSYTLCWILFSLTRSENSFAVKNLLKVATIPIGANALKAECKIQTSPGSEQIFAETYEARPREITGLGLMRTKRHVG